MPIRRTVQRSLIRSCQRLCCSSGCLFLASPGEGHYLRSGAILVGSKRGFGCVFRNVPFDGPQNCISIRGRGLICLFYTLSQQIKKLGVAHENEKVMKRPHSCSFLQQICFQLTPLTKKMQNPPRAIRSATIASHTPCSPSFIL